MVRIDHEVTVNRPPDEVFAYLTDPAKLPEWQATAQEARQETEGPMREGTRLVEVRKFLGRRMESKLEVTAYEPGRRFDLRVVEGPLPFEIRHTFEAEDGGTRIVFSIEGEPGGFFKLAEPIVVRNTQRQVESDFETLKDILEAHA